eukprot:279406_1
MHRVNNSNHRDKSDCLGSDYLNILTTYLRNMPHCTTHLQTLFNSYDETNTDKLNIQQFEELLSVLVMESCTHSGHTAPHNTELTISYILNVLIQLQINCTNDTHSPSHIQFTQHFVTHLLTHLLSLKSKETKITSTPKTNSIASAQQSNIKLKKYKKVSPKLINNRSYHNVLITNPSSNRFNINRRHTINRPKRSQSDALPQMDDGPYKGEARFAKFRSKSHDLNQNELDHVVLASSPSNSLVMSTQNVLFKYQKHHATATKRRHNQHHFGAQLCPPFVRDAHHISSSHPVHHTRSQYTLASPMNMNHISIERVPFHGIGSPSDSSSTKSSKSSNKHKQPKPKTTRSAKSSHSIHSLHHTKSIHSMQSVQTNDSTTTQGMNHIELQQTQRGVQISRRRTENNLLQISRKATATARVTECKQTESDDEDEEEGMTMDGKNEHLMLDLLSEMSILQKEHKRSRECYTTKICELEDKLKTVESENNLMQQTMRLYEHRIVQMERIIHGHAHPPNNYYSQPMSDHQYYHSHTQAPLHHHHHHHTYRPQMNTRHTHNVSVSSSSSSSASSHSTSSSISSKQSKSCRRLYNTRKSNLDPKELAHESGMSSKKRRAMEKKLHFKILQERKHELQSQLNEKSRKNMNLLRKQKSRSMKTFEAIELENNIVLNDDHLEGEALQIDPNAITLPLIIDESVTKECSPIGNDHASAISMLSGDDDEDEKDETHHQILEALHEAVQQSKADSVSCDDSSDCFYLFDDDDGVSQSHSHSVDNEPKYTDARETLQIAPIVIPKGDGELLKKVKPAYKYHLEMIDDDGSITYEVEQRKKRREREKQQQQMKQQIYSQRQQQQQHTSHIKMCYFESKPLGFQINESPQSIFVTNVYRDRGSAFHKGIQRGWKIVEVNKQNGVKGMMAKLRNNSGPFNITFDTFSINKHYNKMI